MTRILIFMSTTVCVTLMSAARESDSPDVLIYGATPAALASAEGNRSVLLIEPTTTELKQHRLIGANGLNRGQRVSEHSKTRTEM